MPPAREATADVRQRASAVENVAAAREQRRTTQGDRSDHPAPLQRQVAVRDERRILRLGALRTARARAQARASGERAARHARSERRRREEEQSGERYQVDLRETARVWLLNKRLFVLVKNSSFSFTRNR